MSDVVIAPNEADARAAAAVEQHHAELSGALRAQVERLLTAAARSDSSTAEPARRQLVEWCERELVPHALAEEDTLYPAAGRTTEGRLLVESMLAEHALIVDLVRQVADSAADLVRAAAAATALRTMFDSHLEKENGLILPLLLRTPGESVAMLLEGMHELLGGHEEHGEHGEHGEPGASGGCGGHTCSCGEAEAAGHPELDARTIPHAIRHATIFGALDAVRPGAGLVLVAPHDPLPLLAQINERWPGVFDVDYLESGPEAWRLQLVRTT